MSPRIPSFQPGSAAAAPPAMTVEVEALLLAFVLPVLVLLPFLLLMRALRWPAHIGSGNDSIDNGGRFQVKRIAIKPVAARSLQMHHHRA